MSMSNAAVAEIVDIVADLQRKAGGHNARHLIPFGDCRIVDVEISNDGGYESFRLLEDPEKREAERKAAKMVLDLIREHRPEWLAA